MKVKVKLFATLRTFGPEEQEMELPENSTIEDIIKLLKLPEKIPLLRIVNGEHRKPTYPLKEGDEIALFPPIAGGQVFRDLLSVSDRKKYHVILGKPLIDLLRHIPGGIAVEEDLFAPSPEICRLSVQKLSEV